jgi:hypothetical protein
VLDRVPVVCALLRKEKTEGGEINTVQNYSESSLALRQRSSWEAIDAGILLWRKNFIYFIPFFAVPVWIIAFSFRFLPGFLLPWTYLFFWYLKPFFDRMVLHIIAVRFFEPQSGVRRLLKGYAGHLFKGLPGDLLWRRFSPWRAVFMPVRVLENLTYKTAKNRKQTLANGGINFCITLTVFCFALEAFLFAGDLLFTGTMTEIIYSGYSSKFFENFGDYEIFFYAIYCFNMIIAESLYVCMGFGLYINSRIEVEGWDIQLMIANFVNSKKAPETLS